MRSILLINPNTNRAMTQRMAQAAARRLPEGMTLQALTADFGFPVIATRVSFAIAAHAVLDTYARRLDVHDAVVIGCFGDPGLEALREIASEPVFALAESSIREADARGKPFAILTLGEAWVDMLTERVKLAAVNAPFIGVFAGEGTGLDAERREIATVRELERLAREAIAAGADTLILGGGALTGMASRLNVEAVLIDCMEATMRLALSPAPASARRRQPSQPTGLTEHLSKRFDIETPDAPVGLAR